jgi:hypothetical protein
MLSNYKAFRAIKCGMIMLWLVLSDVLGKKEIDVIPAISVQGCRSQPGKLLRV